MYFRRCRILGRRTLELRGRAFGRRLHRWACGFDGGRRGHQPRRFDRDGGALAVRIRLWWNCRGYGSRQILRARQRLRLQHRLRVTGARLRRPHGMRLGLPRCERLCGGSAVHGDPVLDLSLSRPLRMNSSTPPAGFKLSRGARGAPGGPEAGLSLAGVSCSEL